MENARPIDDERLDRTCSSDKLYRIIGPGVLGELSATVSEPWLPFLRDLDARERFVSSQTGAVYRPKFELGDGPKAGGYDNVPEDLVSALCALSAVRFRVDIVGGQLRSDWPEDAVVPEPPGLGAPISVTDALRCFGWRALYEAAEYGSWRVDMTAEALDALGGGRPGTRPRGRQDQPGGSV